MANNAKIPVGRNNLFYSDEDFDFETDILIGYMEEDLNQTVVLYSVDRKNTQTDALYKSATQGIRFMPPVEIPCMFEIEGSQIKSYDTKTSNGVYVLSGNLTVYVMPKVLEKYSCDIRRGDYIGVQIDVDRMSYFVVTDDGKMNNANNLYVGAYKTAWRVVKCSPVSDTEFTGK
ncbi:MAG: hypothetical protein J6X18_12230 [Bacteroidales bacterium]|nr:hypothetical protein [Bacteroidales bacterium]